MKWINLIGLLAIFGIMVRYYKETGYLIAAGGSTAAGLYSVTTLQGGGTSVKGSGVNFAGITG